jgi:hypothetical protein
MCDRDGRQVLIDLLIIRANVVRAIPVSLLTLGFSGMAVGWGSHPSLSNSWSHTHCDLSVQETEHADNREQGYNRRPREGI